MTPFAAIHNDGTNYVLSMTMYDHAELLSTDRRLAPPTCAKYDRVLAHAASCGVDAFRCYAPGMSLAWDAAYLLTVAARRYRFASVTLICELLYRPPGLYGLVASAGVHLEVAGFPHGAAQKTSVLTALRWCLQYGIPVTIRVTAEDERYIRAHITPCDGERLRFQRLHAVMQDRDLAEASA
jgi:hypothetical protein